VLKCEPGQTAECSTIFSNDDSIFAGHFPGNPLVPGVILTEALAQTAGIAAASGFAETVRPLFLLAAIRGMKFLSAVRPESEIRLRAEKLAQNDDLWQFKVVASVSGKTVAEGQLVLSRVAKSSSPTLE
jgi:3-hydroxyacyl-[acyl-carrier-protein] dehydratase